MDLKKKSTKKKANEGVEVEILDPETFETICDENGNETPLFVTVLGADSDLAIAQGRRRTQAVVKKMMGARGAKASMAKVDTDELVGQRDEDLAELVVGWRNFEESGEVLECTRENVLYVFKEYPFVKEQVRDAVNDRSRFLAD